MKKILITAVITSMLTIPLGVFAEGGSEARLSGIYESHNDIKIIHNVENPQSIAWYSSSAKDGAYAQIAGEENLSYKVKSADSGKWIKAVVTDEQNNFVETEPRKIEAKWDIRCSDEIIPDILPETPAKNLFSLDGEKFILLDTTEDEDARFLVMTKDSVGERVFSEKKSQSFGNMIGFLNNLDTVQFYYNTDTPSSTEENYSQSGYIGNEQFKQLPQAVFASIDKNRVWKTEAMASGQLKERVYCGGIAIPAVSDIKKYSDKIGWKDSGDFWFRTPSKASRTSALFANSAALGKTESKAANENTAGLRLMFYLDKDFFIKNKVSDAGSAVLETMWSQYTKDQLLNIYTQEELTALGYIDFSIESFTISDDAAHICLNSRLNAGKDITVLVAAYDENGLLCGVNIKVIPCSEGSNNADIELEGGDGYSSAMAVIINSVQNPAPIYKAVRISK